MASVVLCGTIAVSAALFFVTPSYSASVKLYVSGMGATASDQWSNGEYARTHISSYADLVNSNELLQAVRDKLGIPSSGGEGQDHLADSISASNPLDTLIIDVTVKDSSPEQAQAVAAATGQVYDSVVARLENPSGGQSPVRINVVSPPNLPTKDGPSPKLYTAVGLVVGLAVGTAVAWLLELRQPRRRRVRVNLHQRPDVVDDAATGPKTTPKTLPGLRRPERTAPIALDGNGARWNETEEPRGADL